MIELHKIWAAASTVQPPEHARMAVEIVTLFGQVEIADAVIRACEEYERKLSGLLSARE